MNIEIFGGSERQHAAKDVISEIGVENESVKILPIPSSRDGYRITGTEIQLDDFLKNLNRESFVIGYGLPQRFKESIESIGAMLYDAGKDEDFLLENAYITAIGALSYILGTSKKIPKDVSFGIVGYGRIGSALVRMLLFFGARVKIFSSKKLTRIELGLCGIDSPEIELASLEASAFDDLDVVFNTAPTNLSHIFPKKRVPEGMRVIDLASGDSFPGVLGVEYLPSLPDRMYPESAGAAYAKYALAKMRKEDI